MAPAILEDIRTPSRNDVKRRAAPRRRLSAARHLSAPSVFHPRYRLTINMFVFAPAVAQPYKILSEPSEHKWCTNTKRPDLGTCEKSICATTGRIFKLPAGVILEHCYVVQRRRCFGATLVKQNQNILF